MKHLFDRFHGTYMDRWVRNFPDVNAINNWTEVWSEAFIEGQYTPEEIRRGFDACRKSFEWPPTLPEFLKACRPELDPEAAFYEAVAQMHKRRHPVRRGDELVAEDVWSHPAIYWAAVRFGGDLMNSTYSQVKGRWKAALDEAMKDCPEVPPVRQALPAPGRTTVSAEEGRRRIRELMGTLGMNFSGGANDKD
jgi:hypothetical protein